MPVDNKNKMYRITQFSVRSGCPKINSAKVQPKLLLRSAKPAYAYGSGAGFNLAKLHHPWQPVIYIHCEFSHLELKNVQRVDAFPIQSLFVP